MNEIELEEQLGYRRTGLTRKLNGHEQLTMRDVVRLGSVFGPEVLGSLSDSVARSRVVSEPVSRYESGGERNAREMVAEAGENLKEAAAMLRRDSTRDVGLADAFVHLAKAVLALGADIRATRSRTSPRN